MNDSREYRFPYLIRTSGDFPEDFAPFAEDVLYPGLFLPRDDPDWFGRSANPPRVLLITPESLRIHFHPAARIEPRALPFDQRLSVETGRMLLIGWIGFESVESAVRLPYNRRVDEPVRNFLAMLRARLLDPGPNEQCDCQHIGDPLDLKFQNCIRLELDASECELARFFVAPRGTRLRKWLLKRVRWTPGDLAILTDRRIIWITERYRGGREIYGSFVSWTRADNVASIQLREQAACPCVVISLANGRQWSMPLREDMRAAGTRFAREAERILSARAVHGAR